MRSLRAVILLAAVACGGDAAQRARDLDSMPAQRLVGAWQISLRVDRPVTLAASDTGVVSLNGTVALLENRYGRLSFSQMSTPTHVGVYDVDFSALGFETPERDVLPVVVAHTAERGLPGGRDAKDSLSMVLNPGSSRYALMLSGRFSGDSIVGTWHAESLLGGGGVFVLRRVERR